MTPHTINETASKSFSTARTTFGANLRKKAKPRQAAERAPAAPQLELNGNKGFLSGTIPGKLGATDTDMAKKLMDMMQVDQKVWGIERMKIGMHEMGYKRDVITTYGKDKEAHKTTDADKIPLYSIQIWLKRKVQEMFIRDTFEKMLREFKIAKPLTNVKPKSNKDGMLLEVDIFDPHFGKLSWEQETGSNYDLKIASTQYAEALEGLIDRAKGFPVSRILFPVGNDYFHVDTQQNTTTGGTPQDVDGRWQKSFITGRKAMVSAILRLMKIAPVDVIMVPGNHDQATVFYLGEVLSGIFGNTKNITVDNAPTTRKYYSYGQNLLGFTHGNLEKPAQLPLIMATEQREAWATSKFREIHCGHYHSLKTVSFLPVEEFNSIRVRFLSSLTPPDSWHKRMGYNGLRSANAFIWHKDEGNIASLSYQAVDRE